MPLTDCRECGKEVSTDADACPSCGADQPAMEGCLYQLRQGGVAMQGCGCLLTLLVTVPFLVLVCAS